MNAFSLSAYVHAISAAFPYWLAHSMHGKVFCARPW